MDRRPRQSARLRPVLWHVLRQTLRDSGQLYARDMGSRKAIEARLHRGHQRHPSLRRLHEARPVRVAAPIEADWQRGLLHLSVRPQKARDTLMSRRAELVLWAALFVVHLAPVWGFRYFPTQDGPSHLENANILLLLDRPDLPVFKEYFAINRKPTPNWLGHLALAGLILISSPLLADKILLTGYVLALPLAVRYAFRAARPESAPLAVLSFPFLYNCLLHYGFYNFCLSIVLFFVVIGYWLGRKTHIGWRDTAALGIILLALYGSHVVSWGLALLALVI